MKRRWTTWILAGALAALFALPVAPARAQMTSSGIVGIAGGSLLAGLGPLSATVAPVLGPLVGGLVPLVGAIENAPCFICVGVRVQPKDRDTFLEQFHTGVRALPGFNASFAVAAPFEEGGRLNPDQQEQLVFVQFGGFDISLNPETNEVQFGFVGSQQSRLPIADALPIGPNLKSDQRLKIGELGPGGVTSPFTSSPGVPQGGAANPNGNFNF